MQQAILYQAYSGMDFINECRYSLLKYLQVYNLTPPRETAIIIYTDRPAAFSDFLPFFQQFECRELQPDQIKSWRGAINFVHRLKIEMLAHCLQNFDGSILYCDTDTYITQPIEPLFAAIEKGDYFMHQYEGVIDKTTHPSFHKWEKFLSATTIQFNNKQLHFHRQLKMFNAGVVGISSYHKNVLTDVLALTDNIYKQFPKHIAEQFAFSYCLQNSGNIQIADGYIAHYWNLKEFRHLLQLFFSQNAEESIPNHVKKLQHINAMAIQHDKNAFEKLAFLPRLIQKIKGNAWKIGRYEKKL